MKHKIRLKIILILILMLVTLSVCAKNQNNLNNDTNNDIQNSINEVTISKGKNIKKINKFTELKYAQVEFEDNTRAIVDENLNIVLDNSGSIPAENFANGYITYNPYIYAGSYVKKLELNNSIIKDGSYITDFKGNTILEKKEGVSYTNVSKSGYVAMRTDTDTLSGVVSKYKIIDLKGNTVYDETEKIIKYLGEDMFYTEDNFVVNAKTGEKTLQPIADGESIMYIDFTKNNSFGFVTVAGMWSNWWHYIINANTTVEKEIKTYDYDVTKFLSENYILDNDTIRTVEGELIKSLSEGGCSKIAFDNNQFFIISNTGFFYVLDTSGNYIIEPIKILEKGSAILIKNTPYAFEEETGILKKYDFSSKQVKEIMSTDTEDKYFVIKSLDTDKVFKLEGKNSKYITTENDEILSIL